MSGLCHARPRQVAWRGYGPTAGRGYMTRSNRRATNTRQARRAAFQRVTPAERGWNVVAAATVFVEWLRTDRRLFRRRYLPFSHTVTSGSVQRKASIRAQAGFGDQDL